MRRCSAQAYDTAVPDFTNDTRDTKHVRENPVIGQDSKTLPSVYGVLINYYSRKLYFVTKLTSGGVCALLGCAYCTLAAIGLPPVISKTVVTQYGTICQG